MPEPTSPQGFSLGRCKLLRSKSMFVEEEPDPSVARSDSGICWCVHTQNCLGPDGDVVTPENCRPGRSCFEPL